MELQVLKSIAGFMNARGGTLFIGVDDGGVPLGLDHDLSLTGNRGRDGFENSLTTLLEKGIGKVAAANVTLTFERLDGREICRIDVEPGQRPTYVSWKNDQHFFVRLNNSTRPLSIAESVDYIGQRWR
jgi:predicted HTH transcriptional regulator